MKILDQINFREGEFKPFYDFWRNNVNHFGDGFVCQQVRSKKAEGVSIMGTLTWSIEEGSEKKMREIYSDKDGGIFLTLFCAVAVLLKKYTGQENVIVDSPLISVSNNKINFKYDPFVPLLVRIAKNQSLKMLMDTVQSVLKDCYRYQDYPRQVVHSKESLFSTNVMATYHGLHATPTEGKKYDFVFSFRKHKNAIEVTVDYNKDCFEDYFIKELEHHFAIVLRALVFNLDSKVSDIDILTPREKEMIRSFNDTPRFFPQSTIHQMFENQVTMTPEAVALEFEEVSYTYDELNKISNRLARYLSQTFNVKRGQIIGLMLGRSDRLIIGILAILKAGATYLPLDPNYPEERLDFIIKDASINLLLTDSDYLFKVNYYNGDLVALDIQLPSLDHDSGNLDIEVSGSDLAYIIYTSGSTGVPKGVMIEHRSNINMSLDQVAKFYVTSNDRVLLFASLAFDASISEIFMAFYSGATLIVPPLSVIEDGTFIDYINKKRISTLTLPPSYLTVLELEKASYLRCLITAGEATDISIARRVSKVCKYFNAYGPTECSVCVSLFEFNPDNHNYINIPIGRPLANLTVSIVDPEGNEVPVGVEGEIYVAGVALARGYLNNPVMTNSKFIEHPKVKLSRVYKTGDYARWLPDGNIEFIGRIDGQVKIRGYRLELGEIESVLLRHESIKDAVVFDKEEPDGTRSLTAYFVSDENLGLAGLREFMGLSLICFMVPNHLVRVDSFPLTVSGKIDKQALINRSSLEIDTIGYFPPTCPGEECMVAIWEEFFDKKVGIKDNFFELGGNSLMAIKIVTRLQEHFNVSINEFFMNQTIETLYHNVIKNSATIA